MTACRRHESLRHAPVSARPWARTLAGFLALAALGACGSDVPTDASPLRAEPARHTALLRDDTLPTALRASVRATIEEIRGAQGHPRFSGVFFVDGERVSVGEYVAYMELMAREGRVPDARRARRGPRRSPDGVLSLSCTNDPYAVLPDPDCEVGGGTPIDTTADPPVMAVAPSEWLDVAGTAAIFNANFSGYCRDIITKTVTFGRGGFLVATWHTGSYELGYVQTTGEWFPLTTGGIRGIESGSTAESEAKKNTCVPGDVDYRSYTWHNTRTLRYSVARDLLISAWRL